MTFSNEQSFYTTGNAFADFVTMGAISTFQQDSSQQRYYQRYQVLEPYLQDDWMAAPRLTVNVGLRISMFGVYHEKYHNAYNWESSAFSHAVSEGVQVDPDGERVTGPTSKMIFPNPRQLLLKVPALVLCCFEKRQSGGGVLP